MFSIVIPTFNNLNYLSLCIDSIRKNSKYTHEIILHVNEGRDGTLGFARSNKIIHTYSANNIGLCSGVNLAAEKATKDYILYSHDDMYFCPGWDHVLNDEIKNINTTAFYLSGTMIEKNSGHIQLDCGDDYFTFDEKKLLENYNKTTFFDHQGSHWAPHLIHRYYWNKIGGLSEEFNPGIGSDPDLNFKLWKNNVRIFKGLEKFRVYHFGSISLRKKNNLVRNKGAKSFLRKWGITVDFFKKYYLRTGTKYTGPLNEPAKNFSYFVDFVISKIKLLKLILFKS